jgi:hypothetical protein
MAFTYDRILRRNTNLSSRQNEFASNSGSTSVAFIIRAATTALHIYKNKTTLILNLLSLLPSIIQNIHDESCFRGIFLVIIILHFYVKKNHTALRCWFKPPLHRTRKYPLPSDSGGGAASR